MLTFLLHGAENTIEDGAKLAEAVFEKTLEGDSPAGVQDQPLIYHNTSALESSAHAQSSVCEAMAADDSHTHIDEVPREEKSRPVSPRPFQDGLSPPDDSLHQESPYIALTYETTPEACKGTSRLKSWLADLLPIVFAERDPPARKALRSLYSTYSTNLQAIDVSQTLQQLMTSMRRLYAQDFIGLELIQPKTNDLYTIRQCIASGLIGWVFEAVRSDGAKVALKVVSRPQLYNGRTHLDPEACRNMMVMEINVLRHNSEHSVSGLAQSLASWSDLCFVYVVIVSPHMKSHCRQRLELTKPLGKPLYPTTSLDLFLQHTCKGDLHKLCAAQLVRKNYNPGIPH